MSDGFHIHFVVMFDRFSLFLKGSSIQTDQNSKFWPALSEFSPNEIHIGLDRTPEIDTTWISVKSHARKLLNCYQKPGNYPNFLDIVFKKLLSRFYSVSEILKVFLHSIYDLPCEMNKLNKGSTEKGDIKFHKTHSLPQTEDRIKVRTWHAKTRKFFEKKKEKTWHIYFSQHEWVSANRFIKLK